METQRTRIHPLIAGAAVAVIIVSLVGAAAITGHLPGSTAARTPESPIPAAAKPTAAYAPAKPAAVRETPARPVHRDSVTSARAGAETARHPVCNECGVVLDVREVTVKGKGTGLGAVAGGLAGVLVGSQIGDGRGKVLAEVAGAAGGAYAGHQIEKNARSEKQYRVSVKMTDGSVREISSSTPLAWRNGDRVRVVNNSLEPAT